jgi:ribosome biogenesis GTPase
MENQNLATRQAKWFQKWMDERARHESGVKKTKSKVQGNHVRPRAWTEAYLEDPDGYDDLDIEAAERIMPKGETEWRQAKVIRSPLHEGIGEAKAPRASSQSLAQGTVVEIAAGVYTVRTADEVYRCALRKTLRSDHSGYANMLAVGDEVTISHNGHAQGMVEAILPRRSALARPDAVTQYKQQIIVANVDQLLIVASWREPRFWPELVDRYLIAALRHNLAPIVAINKVDLAEDQHELAAAAAAYRAAGCTVLLTSATTGLGIDTLQEVLVGRTTALAGLSGVGKSSLLTAAEPGLNLKVGEVSERKHEGRHTTTQVTLHPLARGGFVVDTPGIRDMGLAGLKREELLRFYPEFSPFAGECQYGDCTHTAEPWCAVKSAMRSGRLSRMRLESYWKILADL